jgi:hypothetical protein
MPTKAKQIDLARVQQRLAAGESQDAIARSLGVAQSTLSTHLAKARRAAQSPHNPAGLPQGVLGPPQPDQAETAIRTNRAAPLPSPGGPENTEGGPSQGISDIHQGGPLPKVDQGGPLTLLSAQDLEDLQALLGWWRDRQRLVQDVAAPERQLERQTYHVEKRFIEAVRREADLTGESYAAVVNRAFAQYFARKLT